MEEQKSETFSYSKQNRLFPNPHLNIYPYLACANCFPSSFISITQSFASPFVPITVRISFKDSPSSFWMEANSFEENWCTNAVMIEQLSVLTAMAAGDRRETDFHLLRGGAGSATQCKPRLRSAFSTEYSHCMSL